MKSTLILTGILGLFASIFVGIGEYLLHYDPLARFAEGGFVFMQGIAEHRTTIGHFFGVFGATLYPVGCYHIYLMLRSANQPAAKTAFFVSAFGFIVGAVWISSRAHISSLMQLPQTADITHLIELYELRYEVLLTVVRIAVLVLSIVFIWLTLTGRSNYPRWMAVFNPFVLILVSFAIYLVAPEIGKHLMPIALNVAFFTFFLLSLKSAKAVPQQGQ
ncbi:hypothetical protein J3L16_13700 [Alteromonas sp. 5E99-2]|uniref:DUF6796 family protein n=1 Tax=Alteromonas sp. 5E99-2 TaxID=2817683 RepID=UPI001A997265|nr:DUF6796 family protein [Alteromonas sp. 5E99-2]MBO1256742.1 hypothetical protein [Alteromonas sp. 5E99-2]